jgi:Zn-dependent protease with chaperone function
MMTGSGIFFDGITSARRAVAVELERESLIIRSLDVGDMLARWRYDELDHISSPEGLLRLGRIGTLARLEVKDPVLATAIDDASVPVDRSGATERRARLKVIGWSLAAVVSLIAGAVLGVPLVADRIAPLVPQRVENWLGDAVDAQTRAMLDTKQEGAAFECGTRTGEQDGRAAMDKLVHKLEVVAGLPVPLKPVVVRRSEANASALPGGRIYVYAGLIEKAESADEVAGVIAHEIGHVLHRDGTRSIIQAAGLSFMFGMLLGDFVGGSAVVIGARAVLKSSYSRDVEASADQVAVDLMRKAGGDQRALAAILTRISGANHPGVQILADHPDTRDRVAAINKASTSAPSQGLLEPTEWAALKRICGGR